MSTLKGIENLWLGNIIGKSPLIYVSALKSASVFVAAALQAAMASSMVAPGFPVRSRKAATASKPTREPATRMAAISSWLILLGGCGRYLLGELGRFRMRQERGNHLQQWRDGFLG